MNNNLTFDKKNVIARESGRLADAGERAGEFLISLICAVLSFFERPAVRGVMKTVAAVCAFLAFFFFVDGIVNGSTVEAFRKALTYLLVSGGICFTAFRI